MKTKTLVIAVVVLAAILGLMLWGRGNAGLPAQAGAGNTPNQTNQNSESSLAAAETFFDFGTITMKAGNVEHAFEIMNPTDKDVTISDMMTSCMCTTAYLDSPSGMKGPFGMPGHGGPMGGMSETLKPGEARTVKVVFDPNAHGPAGVGSIDRLVYVTEQNGGTLQLEIKAMVTP